MSYTFICTPSKSWYLKITSVEHLLDYWNNVFNPRLKQALDTIRDTKEYGRTMQHCDKLQMLIGETAKGENLTYEDAYEKIVYEHRIGQYQALCNGNTIYINKNFGWDVADKEIDQFIHKNNFGFPAMKSEKIKIEQFPMGTHFYVFIDGVQLRQKDNLKFNSYQEAFEFAQRYIK